MPIVIRFASGGLLIDLAEKQKTRTRRVFRGATSGNRVPEAIT